MRFPLVGKLFGTEERLILGAIIFKFDNRWSIVDCQCGRAPKSPRGKSAGGRLEFHQGLNQTFEIMAMRYDMQSAGGECAQFEKGMGADCFARKTRRKRSGLRGAMALPSDVMRRERYKVYDFSSVRTVFRVFHPISQPQGFDFSPVREKAGEKFLTANGH
jgi:hypothetical protein